MTAIFKCTIYNVQFKIIRSQALLTIKLFLILIAFIFTFYILHFTFLNSAFAQTPTISAATPPATTYQLPAIIPPTSPLYTDLLVNNLFHTFSCLAIGQSVIGQPCLTYQMTKNAQGMLQGIPVLSQTNLSGGTLGAVSSIIAALYQNPPVRTADYLASAGQGLGIIKEAHAQTKLGSGEAVLHPILTLWQVSRNISYVVMIIIFLIIGLMVMFRNKINPQTVITAQTALPGLVIGLVLITFSYFFAGLISDFAFISTNLVGFYFSAAQGTTPPQDLVKDISGQNVVSIVSPLTGIIDKDIATNFINSIWDQLGDGAKSLLTLMTMFITAQTTSQGTEVAKALPAVGAFIQAVITAGAVAATWANPTPIIGVALALIATAILMYSMFKLLIRLLNNYITIIFLTLTAPFQLLAAALPGRQGIATGWILNMLANVLAFPAVLAVLYFVVFLLGPNLVNDNKNCAKPCPFKVKVSEINQINSDGFIRPVYAAGKITDTQTFPLFGGMDLSFINLLLAFGALMALPSIPDIISRTIGRLGVAGQLIGQEIGGSVGQGRGYAGQFQRGIGGASSQLATARGLAGTKGYELVKTKTGYVWRPSQSPVVTSLGGVGRFRARVGSMFGGRLQGVAPKPPKGF